MGRSCLQDSAVTGWDGDKNYGNGVGMGTECSKRCGNGLGTGTRIHILRGSNGVKHLSPCHSLTATLSQLWVHTGRSEPTLASTEYRLMLLGQWLVIWPVYQLVMCILAVPDCKTNHMKCHGLAVAYVNCETYRFNIYPHETPQIKSHNQKCTSSSSCMRVMNHNWSVWYT